MLELLEHALSSVNIIPTGILTFCLLYWIIVMFGLLHMDSFDLDLDTDVDVHADIDVHADVDVHADMDVHADAGADVHGDVDGGGNGSSTGGVGWLNSILIFFNLGQIPLMIFLSFLALPMWFASMAANYYLNNESFLFSVVILIPIFIASLFVAKFLTTPFVKFFAHLTKGDVSIKSYIGKICKVILVAEDDKKGQAEIKIEGGSYLISTKVQPGVEIKKGENALIIDFDEDNKSYLIEPYHDI